MRYYHETDYTAKPLYGCTYVCNHPQYDRCTLYLKDNLGLAVVQKRFNPDYKAVYYDIIDADLANDIYQNKNFGSYFKEKAQKSENGIFPTVEIRKLMWELRMKPLKKQFWEKEIC